MVDRIALPLDTPSPFPAVKRLLGCTWLPFQWPGFSEITMFPLVICHFLLCLPIPWLVWPRPFASGSSFNCRLFCLEDRWGTCERNPRAIPPAIACPSQACFPAASATMSVRQSSRKGPPASVAVARTHQLKIPNRRRQCGSQRDCGSAAIPQRGSCMCAT